MTIRLQQVIVLGRRRFWFRFIIFFWICGMLSGMFCAVCTAKNSTMLTVPIRRLSIICHLLILCVPLIISYVLLRFSMFSSVLLYIFCRSFRYFYCKFSLRLGYGAAGWLLSELVFFADNILSCILLAFCLSRTPDRGQRNYIALVCIIILLLIGIIDYYTISPLVESLLFY